MQSLINKGGSNTRIKEVDPEFFNGTAKKQNQES